LNLENFLFKFLDLIIHHEVSKLKLFSQHVVDKTTTQKPKVQQFESTGCQDQQRHLVATTTIVGGKGGKKGKGVGGRKLFEIIY
jgi:hypothetical protein